MVTILVALYNKEEWLADALDSILMQQTDFEYKILIIDDMSTDNSLAIAEEYTQKFPDKIQILKNKTKGYYFGTILNGLKHLKTKYFTVLDPDDYWLTPDKLNNALSYLEQNITIMAYLSNSYLEYNDGSRTPYLSPNEKDHVFSIYENMVSAHTSSVIYRNFFTQEILDHLDTIMNTSNMKYFEGESFRNLLALAHGPIYYSSKIESVYRVTGQGIWTSLDEEERNTMNALFPMKAFIFLEKFSINREFAFSILKKWILNFQSINLSECKLEPLEYTELGTLFSKFSYISMEQTNDLRKKVRFAKKLLIVIGLLGLCMFIALVLFIVYYIK